MSGSRPYPHAVARAEELTLKDLSLLAAHRSVLVAATAGAGKTTLIVRCVRAFLGTLGDRTLQVMAFNVSAADEIRGRCSLILGNLRVDTIQSVWEAAFRHHHRRLRRLSAPVREDVLAWALAQFLPAVQADQELAARLREHLEGKTQGLPPRSSLERQVYDVMAEERRRRRLFDACDVQRWVHERPALVVDYLACVRRVALLLVDEAQDLSRTEWRVISAWIEAGYVVMAVGDTDQTINVFRGADATGMERLVAEHGVEVVELPITWRAKQLLVDFESPLRRALFPGSPELVAAHPGGIGARRTVHLGDKHRVHRTVLATVAAEVLAALGRPVPKDLRRCLPRGYDPRVLAELPRHGLEDLAILVATNKEAKDVVKTLGDHGAPAVLLSARRPDPLAGSGARIVLSALDPWGVTSSYPGAHQSRWLGCLLSELARRKGTKLEKKSAAGHELAQHLVDLARREPEGPEALLDCTKGWLDHLAERFPAGHPASYITQARRVIHAVFTPTESPDGTRRLIEEICAAYDLYYDDEPYAVAQYALDTNQTPLETARRVREWPTYSKANILAPLGKGERRVVVAVVNQAKGLTFEATWLCALGPGKFPFRGVDGDPERCRFWVACTRATDLLVVHLPERDARYLALAGKYAMVGDASPLAGRLARLHRRAS